jgi:hypothetical protein
MGVKVPELLMPDGDGDEERGILAAEMHANMSNPDGSLRTTDDELSQGDRRIQEPAVPLRGGRMLYADPNHVPTPQAAGEHGQEAAVRHERVSRLPRGWMSGMALEATTYTNNLERQRRRVARKGGYAALRVMPGGGFSPPTA